MLPFLTFAFLIATLLLCGFVTTPAFVFLRLFAVFGHVAVLPAIAAVAIEFRGLIAPLHICCYMSLRFSLRSSSTRG